MSGSTKGTSVEIGVFSFGDTYPNPNTGARQAAGANLDDLLERVRLADRLGLDFFGVGEHHRPDFSVSALSTVLAAAAATTSRIRLGTATTVLTTDDPVRLFEQFATLDLLSHGRAEIGVGSGGFLEPYALWGVDFERRHEIFAEKLELLAALNASERVDFDGDSRPTLRNALAWPRPFGEYLPIEQATGLDATSFARAARLGIGVQTSAPAARFGELVELVAEYRRAAAAAGWSAGRTPVTLGAHSYLGDTERGAIDAFFPHYQAYVANMRVNQGKPAPTREQYEQAVADPDSNIFVGDAAAIITKVRHQHAQLGHDRHIFQIDWRAVPQGSQLRAIHILAEDVLPAVRELSSAVPIEPALAG